MKSSKLKFILLFTIIIVILYIIMLFNPPPPVEEDYFAAAAPLWFFVKLIIMVALSMLLAPKVKTRKIKPLGLEQFDIPTAEEGRPIQVLFGKKYIASSNVVWFGHLKAQAVKG